MLDTTLFLCGSLCKDQAHHKLIADAIVQSSNASVIGSAYRLEVGYPVFCSKGEQSIQGQLVELKNQDIIWPLLDQFFAYKKDKADKSVFIRERVKVSKQDGESIEAYVYGLNPLRIPKAATLIADGDWQNDLQKTQPWTEQLSLEEAEYVKKLGKCTGRDIVPYTPLTRILEKQGIVVDKGRRPALTKLGKEIFQFLP